MTCSRVPVSTLIVAFLIVTGLVPTTTWAESGGVTFEDIAAGDGAGITYRRTRSPSEALFDAIRQQPTYTFDDLLATPLKGRGAPGVAILDFDRDGDLDLYVTNGPGTANSLYANQWIETGALTFVDVATAAGVDAIDQDATGTCFGDIDNDGDHDLVSLGNLEPNRLFENLGDGTFDDISAASGISTAVASSTSCSFGDIDNDGYLDLVVGNALDMRQQFGIFTVPFDLNEPNQLLHNQGDTTFVDVTASAGLLNLDLPGAPPGVATITWAVAMVDIDLDGDVDIVHADDQAAFPPAMLGGIDRGLIHLFENDGNGQFTGVTLERGLGSPGAWMALSFGDFDHNGRLDLFGSNFGNHGGFVFNPMGDPTVYNADSRWYLQQADGTFVDSTTQAITHTPFGWGTSAFDYDNDGDTDIVFHGGLDVGPFITSNPGALLANDGTGHFTRDAVAFAGSTDHLRRTVHGLATGDLDNDGFRDIVTVANQNFPTSAPLTPFTDLGGEFQVDAEYLATFLPIDPANFVFQWSGIETVDGTLAVERARGNHNRSLSIEVIGTKGIAPAGAVNRDGIGAVVTVTPRHGRAVILPVLGGASYASQDSLRLDAGLGDARLATIEVLWPGGVRNRLDRARAGQRVRLPEIPCSIDTDDDFATYLGCVVDSLVASRDAGLVTPSETIRLFVGAVRGYFAER